MPPFHPLDVLDNVQRALLDKPLRKLLPWWRHFTGSVKWRSKSDVDIVTRGVARVADKRTVEITELPVGRWTTTQKEYLEEMAEIGTIESFRELHSEHRFVLLVLDLDLNLCQ